MPELINAVVISPARELDTRYGRKLLLKAKSSGGKEINVWGKPSEDSLRAKRQHEQITLYAKPNGGYELVEQNGFHQNGLKHISQPLEKLVSDLDLPELLTEEERVRLKALIRQRAKLLRHCIDVMQAECQDLDDPRGVRSLGVTLFIHVAKFVD